MRLQFKLEVEAVTNRRSLSGLLIRFSICLQRLLRLSTSLCRRSASRCVLEERNEKFECQKIRSNNKITAWNKRITFGWRWHSSSPAGGRPFGWTSERGPWCGDHSSQRAAYSSDTGSAGWACASAHSQTRQCCRGRWSWINHQTVSITDSNHFRYQNDRQYLPIVHFTARF